MGKKPQERPEFELMQELSQSGSENPLQPLLVDYLKESDRGAVLSVVAAIEHALESVIRTAMNLVPNVDQRDLHYLFQKRPSPPLGSLANKTVIARVIGLIDENTRLQIDAMRDVRNKFAHSMKPLRLIRRHTDRLRQLFPKDTLKQSARIAKKMLDEIETSRKDLPEKLKERFEDMLLGERHTSEEKLAFLWCGTSVIARLIQIQQALEILKSNPLDLQSRRK